MFKQSAVMFLYAETGVHLGGGQAFGAIDLAIQRERYTDYPVGAAAGIKGALRSWFEHRPATEGKNKDKLLPAFGPGEGENASEYAGAVAFTDARILLFPVRSMKGVFAWTTCPAVLERFRRDLAVAGLGVEWKVPTPEAGTVCGGPENANKLQDSKVLLEEDVFTFREDEKVAKLASWIANEALPRGGEEDEYAFWRERLPTHLLILNDDDFGFFVRYSTEVQARVKLNEQKTTGDRGNLFYQENLPSDSLLYSLVLAQDEMRRLNDGFDAGTLLAYIKEIGGKRLQIGGDESVGKGIVSTTFLPESANGGRP